MRKFKMKNMWILYKHLSYTRYKEAFWLIKAVIYISSSSHNTIKLKIMKV